MTTGWNGLTRARGRRGAACTPEEEAERRTAAQEEAAQAEMPQLCARVFGTPDGRKLLRALRRMTKDVVCGPEVSGSALYYLEGRRQLVHQIETWTAQGHRHDPAEFRSDLADE